MGFFSFIADAAKDANDDAHGQRLLSGVQSSFQLIPKLNDRVRESLLMGFAEAAGKLEAEAVHLTGEQRIELGRLLQDQARQKFDVDVAGGYGKWLVGAWLESRERRGPKARQAFSMLTGLIDSVLN